MNRLEYELELKQTIQQWLESVDYATSTYWGLERDISLCLINLHFSGYEKVSLY